MPEETTNTTVESTQTAETAPKTADSTPAATTPAEPAKEAVETAKTEETAKETAEPAKAEEKPAVEEYTVDSYKDLVDDEEIEEFELTDENLNVFKELGAKNHIAPEALKAISKWSLDNIRKQREAAEKVREEWRKQNEEKYGDNLKNVKTNVGRVLADMDKSGQFATLLKDVGAEEHPATLAFLSAIGDVLLEKGSVNPNATVQGKEMSLEDMYRNNK